MTITARPTDDFAEFSDDLVGFRVEFSDGKERREVWLVATGVELDRSPGRNDRRDPDAWGDLARQASDELNRQKGELADLDVLTLTDVATGVDLWPVGHLLRADR